MKIVFVVGLGVVAYVFGYQNGQTAANNRPARYELHDSGVVGAVVRLDKQTGETKVISAMMSDSAVQR